MLSIQFAIDNLHYFDISLNINIFCYKSIMKSNIEHEYTSIACNRLPCVLDWNSDGVICFGASHAVVLYDTKITSGNPLTILCYHQAQVLCVKWLKQNQQGCFEILSTSADKTIAIWSNKSGSYQVINTMKGHTDGVNCVDGIYTGTNLLVFTTSIDSTLRIWERTCGSVKCKQTIPLGSGLCLTLKTHILPIVNKPILFCALDDHKIHVFIEKISSGIIEYHRCHILSGHEDWVRGLDVVDVDERTIMLASSSQDTYIRLWKIQHHAGSDKDSFGVKVEQKLFSACEETWVIKLEAVLSGHEGWIYGVQWHPPIIDKEAKLVKPVYKLLSSSLDKTIIIWEPENAKNTTDGVWVEKVRVGEVGGNGLGFYGSKFGPNGKSFVGHGYNGSLHMWQLNEETNEWISKIVCGGHFGEVVDICWEPEGRYLISVSTDQTTRLHAPWHHNSGIQWHEIARPQVHGYDMSSLAIVSSTVFVSGAEEKVIRAFRAPQNFLQNFCNITTEKLTEIHTEEGPEGATVSSLGLSNKAIFSRENEYIELENKDNHEYFVPVNLTEPPTEETLMAYTLWPEIQKLYGHGYEVYALATRNDILASACRAADAQHAAILVWDTSNWQQIQRLVAHQLTVTQLAFSPDGQRLLSVSRDRRWSLFQRNVECNQFFLVATTDKTNSIHTRIIWCCSWSHDNILFATGSRDGKVCVWHETDKKEETSLGSYALVGKPLDLPNMSITALDFAPILLKENRIIAVGFESGLIKFYTFTNIEDKAWNLMIELNNSAAHHLTVKRLVFKPSNHSDEMSKKTFQLASCGSDHLVHIYNINMDF